jgi:hypothetical protein
MDEHEPSSSHQPLLPYASALDVPTGVEIGEAYWDGGSTLVVHNGATLVDRCILCGNPGSGTPIRLTLTWDSSFHRTSRSTLELRKQAIVYAFLCPAHRTRWARARRWGGLGAVAGLAVMAGGLSLYFWSENSDIPAYTLYGIALTIAGFGAVIVALFYFTLRSRTLSCRLIQEGYLYLEGAAPEFLRSLPRLQTPAGGG